MRFYLDFEATRFSDQIISVGCVTDSGEKFYSLVNPKKHKVDNFITELTGITKEMCAAAPTSESVFESLFDFVSRHSDGMYPIFYVYGNYDATCLMATLKNMRNNFAAQIMVESILGQLVDFSKDVEKFFNLGSAIALRKVYLVAHPELNDFVQEHNALGDAEMLRDVVRWLPKKCTKEHLTAVLGIPSQSKPKSKKKVENPLWTEWSEVASYEKWEVETHADESDWTVRAVSGIKTIYFRSLDEAVLWLVRFNMVKGISPKKQDEINRIKKKIRESNVYCGVTWTLREENVK